MWYSQVTQAVRQYRPSQFLPFLASYSAERERAETAGNTAQWFPWAISALAKESLLRGNEHRHGYIDGPGLARLIHDFNRSGRVEPGQTPASLVTPIMYEQFPYQESLFEEMARTHALLVHNEPGQPAIPWEELLGVALDKAMRASHILHAWVVNNDGRYDPSILDMPHFQEVFEKAAPRSEIEATASLLIADIADLKRARADADAKRRLPTALERYAFNPLKARPLVDLGARGIWAPQTVLVPRVFLGPNLYHRGLDRWGRTFTDGLGNRTERYVGRQLALMDGIEVYPEIEYAKDTKSIDWIWVSEAAIVLVECKAARLTLDAQAGGETLATVMERYLGEARKQIDRTARRIREGHPAFGHIPKDRPIVGLVTTAEPFYLADTPFSGFDSTGEVPVTSMSLRELEILVGLSEADAAALIVAHAHPEGHGGRLGGAFDEEARKRLNPILEDAWRHYDLADAGMES